MSLNQSGVASPAGEVCVQKGGVLSAEQCSYDRIGVAAFDDLCIDHFSRLVIGAEGEQARLQ